MTSSFSFLESTLSSARAANRSRVSLHTCSFSAEKSPFNAIRNPRCLCAWLGGMAWKGTPCKVMLSVATSWPVFLSMAVISLFSIFTSMPDHSMMAAAFGTMIAIAGTASGPSV